MAFSLLVSCKQILFMFIGIQSLGNLQTKFVYRLYDNPERLSEQIPAKNLTYTPTLYHKFIV